MITDKHFVTCSPTKLISGPSPASYNVCSMHVVYVVKVKFFGQSINLSSLRLVAGSIGWLAVCLVYVLLHYSGMLTITDFINILRHHYKSPIVSHHTPFLMLRYVHVHAPLLRLIVSHHNLES